MTLEEDMVERRVVGDGVKSHPVELTGAAVAEDSFVYPKDELVNAFLKFWRSGKYDILYEMMYDTQGLSEEEFVFLAGMASDAEHIEQISIERTSGNTVKFKIVTNRYVKKIPAQLVYSEGWKVKPFYIFESLHPEIVCDDLAESVTLSDCGLSPDDTDKTRCRIEVEKDCLYDYAIVSGDDSYCNMTSERRGECLIELGLSVDLNGSIDDCYAFPRESEQADCLLGLVRANKDIEVCRQTEFERAKYTCYGVIAAATGVVENCEKYIRTDGFFNYYRHSVCVISYVKETQDKSKCDVLSKNDNSRVGAIKEECSRLDF